MITVSGTTIQLLDDSNLQAVATAGGQDNTSAAARMTSERPSAMDGWIGGTWVSQAVPHECASRMLHRTTPSACPNLLHTPHPLPYRRRSPVVYYPKGHRLSCRRRRFQRS